MSGAKQISSTRAKELIAKATESTRILNWLSDTRNCYAVIDRYCTRLLENMRQQKSWDTNAEAQILAMCELAEAKINTFDTALEKHREKHDRLMVELDNETD